jgi:hypothetical protein
MSTWMLDSNLTSQLRRRLVMATGCVAGAQGGRRSLDCERGCNMLSSMLASATPMDGQILQAWLIETRQ